MWAIGWWHCLPDQPGAAPGHIISGRATQNFPATDSSADMPQLPRLRAWEGMERRVLGETVAVLSYGAERAGNTAHTKPVCPCAQ